MQSTELSNGLDYRKDNMAVTIDPKGTKWENDDRLAWVLELEFVHQNDATDTYNFTIEKETELPAFQSRLKELINYDKDMLVDFPETPLDAKLDSVWPWDLYDNDYRAVLTNWSFSWIDAEGYMYDVKVDG